MATVGVLTKEADQGTLSFLLALPISRSQVLFQRFGALLTGLALLHALVAVVMPLALILFGFPPEWGAVALMSLGAFLAQAAIAAILLLVTVFLDETPIATAVALVVGMGLFILTMLLKEQGWQLALRRLSPFHYYQPGAILQQGALPVGDTAILLGILVGATALALALFNRKQVSG
jgi:ABC-2 type transport system permease protein